MKLYCSNPNGITKGHDTATTKALLGHGQNPNGITKGHDTATTKALLGLGFEAKWNRDGSHQTRSITRLVAFAICKYNSQYFNTSQAPRKIEETSIKQRY